MKKIIVLLLTFSLLCFSGCGNDATECIVSENGISGSDFIENFAKKADVELLTDSEYSRGENNVAVFTDAKEDYNLKVDYHESITSGKVTGSSIVFKKKFDMDAFYAWTISVDNTFTPESAKKLYTDLVETQKEDSVEEGDHGIGKVEIDNIEFMLNYFMEDAPRISVYFDEPNQPISTVEQSTQSSNDEYSRFTVTATEFIHSIASATGIHMEQLSSEVEGFTVKRTYAEKYPHYNFSMSYNEYTPIPDIITGIKLNFDSDFNKFIFSNIVRLIDDKTDSQVANQLYDNLLLAVAQDPENQFATILNNDITYTISISEDNKYSITIF